MLTPRRFVCCSVFVVLLVVVVVVVVVLLFVTVLVVFFFALNARRRLQPSSLANHLRNGLAVLPVVVISFRLPLAGTRVE
jgi:amino acid permease